MTERTHATQPPGPQGLPLIGSALQEDRRSFEFLTENARKYGDVVYWEIVNEPIYQLNHPNGIESVLVTNNQRFIKGGLFQEFLGPVLGAGLLNSEGETWRTQRHRIKPLFHPDQITAYADIMIESTERLLADWSDGHQVNIHEDMMGLTLEIVANALLGVDIRRDIQTIGQNLEVILKYIDSLSYQLVPAWAPTPGKRRFERALDALNTIVYRIIQDRKRDPTGADVVTRLVAEEDDPDTSMSTRQLRDEVMTFLLAGHETTALVLTYTWYLLATHPTIERRLITELDMVLGDATPTVDAVPDLTLTDQVITESMRLYPPVGSILREPTEDVTIDGYRIPAGATIWLPQWVVHRDPRWYPDPLAFHPDRWTSEFKTDLPRLAYFPFAAGPRRCVGDRFALLEAKLVLTTMLQHYHLELHPDTVLKVEPAITTRPVHPINMTAHARD